MITSITFTVETTINLSNVSLYKYLALSNEYLDCTVYFAMNCVFPTLEEGIHNLSKTKIILTDLLY